jgi:MFS family permease
MLLSIFLIVLVDLIGFGIVIPILPYYARSFGASATTLGWLMGVYSLMQFVVAPLWGRLSDRIGRRPVCC